MNPIAIRAIEAMVAPVVLITAAAVLSGGVLTVFGSVNDRMRAMTAERLGLLVGSDGRLHAIGDLPPGTRERIKQIDQQLPMLLRRHHLLRIAVQSIYLGIAALVASVIMVRDRRTSKLTGFWLLVLGAGPRRNRRTLGRLSLRSTLDHGFAKCNRL